MDGQCEERSDYYANLVVEIDLPLGPLLAGLRQVQGDEDREYSSRLINETLGALARRGSMPAVEALLEQVRHAHHWDWALDDLIETHEAEICVRLVRAMESRFATQESLRAALERTCPGSSTWTHLAGLSERIREALIAPTDRNTLRHADEEEWLGQLRSMSLRELMHQARTVNRRIPVDILKSAVQPEDLPFLQSEVIRWESMGSASAALSGIEAIVRPDLLNWLVETMLNHPGSHRHKHWLFERTILSLPASVIVSLGRKHWNSPDPRLNRLSQRILAAHADPTDLPRLRAVFPQLLEDEYENHYAICSVAEALARCSGAGPMPELRFAFEEVLHSCTRWFIVPALRNTDPEGFQELYATECLWDCEHQVRSEAVEVVNLDSTTVADRLAAVAADPFEESSVRASASRRLGRAAVLPHGRQ